MDTALTLLHSERPKLYGVLAVLSAIGLKHGFMPSTVKHFIFVAFFCVLVFIDIFVAHYFRGILKLEKIDQYLECDISG